LVSEKIVRVVSVLELVDNLNHFLVIYISHGSGSEISSKI
jgi:hypothetical protein